MISLGSISCRTVRRTMQQTETLRLSVLKVSVDKERDTYKVPREKIKTMLACLTVDIFSPHTTGTASARIAKSSTGRNADVTR